MTNRFTQAVQEGTVAARSKKKVAKIAAGSSNLSTTTNGAVNYKSSLSKCLDLFFNISTFRKNSPIQAFKAAFAEDPVVATRIMMYARDIRGGARERQMFRTLLAHIDSTDPELAIMICTKVPEIGRWDDLLCVTSKAGREFVYAMFAEALTNGNGLAAKWCPREKSARKADTEFAVGLRKFMGISARDYRKMLVQLTNVVETQVCNKTYQNIDYSKLPSLAANRYAKLFTKYDAKRYNKYLGDLTKGVEGVKVNASTLFPYDVLKQGNTQLQDAQWAALPNLCGTAKILPMIDTSGSMGTMCGERLSCRDVAYSLGMYFADKNEGPFGGVFMTFSDKPKMVKLPKNKSVREKYAIMEKHSIVSCTNIERAFTEILHHATTNKVPQEDMPDYLYIFSDMQFDQGVEDGYRLGRTMHENTIRKFEAKGYKAPQIVYWNIAARAGGTPVTMHETGTALVSGFSPDITKAIMEAKSMTPMAILLNAVMIPRYDLN